jgi:hypothetical protein
MSSANRSCCSAVKNVSGRLTVHIRNRQNRYSRHIASSLYCSNYSSTQRLAWFFEDHLGRNATSSTPRSHSHLLPHAGAISAFVSGETGSKCIPQKTKTMEEPNGKKLEEKGWPVGTVTDRKKLKCLASPRTHCYQPIRTLCCIMLSQSESLPRIIRSRSSGRMTGIFASAKPATSRVTMASD